jgi:hypothetical protein
MVREREREASRPYHQFVYQISTERERIQEDSTSREDAGAGDINTKAYENVKNTWTKRGIWDRRWGILPGMSWKHEGSFEELVADDFASVPANPPVNDSHEVGEAPVVRIFGSPPFEANHRQTSGALDLFQQEPPADIDSAGLENDNAKRSSSTSNSPLASSGKRVLRSTTGKAFLSSKRIVSNKEGQPANASLGPVHSSKVTKATRNREGPQQRPKISQKISPNGLPSSCSVDAAESQPSPLPDRVTPRRSNRVQTPVSSVAKDPAKTAHTDHSKCAVRSKPERNVRSNLTVRNSAEPRGVSKRQPAKTTRGKARKI